MSCSVAECTTQDTIPILTGFSIVNIIVCLMSFHFTFYSIPFGFKWSTFKSPCCAFEKCKLAGRKTREERFIVMAAQWAGNSSFLFCHYKISDICVSWPQA